METGAQNFTHDKFPRVKVLYDYTYTDDEDHEIVMRTDEVYFLMNSDGKDWWNVCRPDSPESPFYVPSTYVEILPDVKDSSDQGYSPISKLAYFENGGLIDKQSSDRHSGVSVNKMEEDIYVNTVVDTDSNANIQNENNKTSIHVQYIGKSNLPSRPSDLDVRDEDDYVNLEQYRAQAGIQPPNTMGSSKTQVCVSFFRFNLRSHAYLMAFYFLLKSMFLNKASKI